MKHGVGRNGKKLSTALIEKMSKEYKEETSRLNSNENDDNSQTTSKNFNKLGSDQSEVKSQDEDNAPETTDTGDVSNCSVPSSASAKMTHRCPFPRCCDLVLANESDYFNHLWSVHKLGRNK